jgi:hypothetical protein
MNKKIVYMLLFGLPGLVFSFMISLFVIGAIGGAQWLWGVDFGEAFNEYGWIIFSIVIFLVLWIISIYLGYQAGSKYAVSQAMNKKHLSISLIVFVALIIFSLVFLFQDRLIPESIGGKCMDYCEEEYGSKSSGIEHMGTPDDKSDDVCSCSDPETFKNVGNLSVEEL